MSLEARAVRWFKDIPLVSRVGLGVLALLFPVLLIVSAASALLGGLEPPRADKGAPTQPSTDRGDTTARKEVSKEKASPPPKERTVTKQSKNRPPENNKPGAEGGTTKQRGPSPSTNASEAGAEKAAGDYYRKAGLKDWEYTYSHLVTETRGSFTKEEWRKKNQWLAENNPATYHISAVDLDERSQKPLAKVIVRLTGEDGSTSTRNTQFVLEDGSWRHRLVQEELDLFEPGVPYEEWVKAQG